LTSNVKSEVASALKGLKCSVKLRSDTSVSKREYFKQTHWASFKRASNCG